MTPQEADRVQLRLVFSSYANFLLIVAAPAISALLFPWYSTLWIAALSALNLFRMIWRQATWIAFDATGVEIGLLLREHHIRAPVAEFNGSRTRGISVRDLHADKTYLLTTLRRGRKLIELAERHGYAVVSRPRAPFFRR
jgi:hypothetical protein